VSSPKESYPNKLNLKCHIDDLVLVLRSKIKADFILKRALFLDIHFPRYLFILLDTPKACVNVVDGKEGRKGGGETE
jgi:hypothetical protein